MSNGATTQALVIYCRNQQWLKPRIVSLDKAGFCHQLSSSIQSFTQVLALQHRPACVLLSECDLPGAEDDLAEVLKIAEQSCCYPIVTLLSQYSSDKVKCLLRGGSHEVLPAQIDGPELALRMQTLGRIPALRNQSEIADELCLDCQAGIIQSKGKIQRLTDIQCNILSALYQRKNQLVARDELFELALGRPEESFDRSLDMHVSRLRKKLQILDLSTIKLSSIRGKGYILYERGE